MIRRERKGVVFYHFESLAQYPEVLHAIFTRIGGASQGPFSTLNVGHLVGDEPAAVEANHTIIFRTLNLCREQVVTARQVHGNNVAVVGRREHNTVVPQTDALITQDVGTALLLRFADCLPLLLYDRARKVVALAHVGWRGCVAGVVRNVFQTLQSVFQCKPADFLACLGPAIGPCCYEVGPQLISAVEQAFGTGSGLLLKQPNGRVHFDLPAAVQRQLQTVGVEHIENSGLCTHCRTNEFFSHRAERGNTGRFAAVLALRQTLRNSRKHPI